MADVVESPRKRVEVVATNPVYAVLAVHGPRVDLHAPVRAFFDESLAQQRRPILQTDSDATLGPFVVSRLRAQSGFWVTNDRHGTIREVQTGSVVTDPIQLFDSTASVEEPPESAFSHAAVMIEIVLEHRANPGTSLGGAVPLALEALGAAPPAAWGSEEPLPHPWDLRTLTEHARSEMPLTGPIYWRSADGYGEIAAARTEDRVAERIQVAVSHEGQPLSGLGRARDAVAALAASRMPIMTCAASAVGAHADLRTRPAPAPPERPLAAYLGPTVLGRLELSAAEVAAAHAGEEVGRARLPGVLVVFDDELHEARRRYLRLAAG